MNVYFYITLKQNEGVFGQNLSSTRRGALIGTSIRWAPAYGVVGTASRVDYFITNELSIGTNFMVYQNLFNDMGFGPSLQYFFTEKVFTQINVDIYQQSSFDGASFARWGLLNLDTKLGYWQKIGDNVAVAPMLNIGYYPGIELGLAINI